MSSPVKVMPCFCGANPGIRTYVRGFRIVCPVKACRARGIQRPTLKGAILFWNRDQREYRKAFA